MSRGEIPTHSNDDEYDGLARTWTNALKAGNFAIIADWFKSWFMWFGGSCLLFIFVAASFQNQSTLWAHFAFGLRTFALAALLAGATGIVGWLFGLLFGIPRTLARPTSPAPSPPVQSTHTDAAEPTRHSRVNTNLEDISDWLTKTLVGVSLTQLNSFPKFLGDLGEKIDTYGFAWNPYGHLVAIGIILYFTPGGFWLGYVGTRTILTKLFEEIDAPVPSRGAIAAAKDPDKLELSGTGSIKPATADIAPTDNALLRLKLEQLTTTDQVVAWAAAHARSGELSTAQGVLENVLKNNPGDKNVRQQLATVYAAAGDHAKSNELLKGAPDSLTAVVNSLYEPAPFGYRKAIEIGERLASDRDHSGDPNLHVWLACAYGQQYTDLKLAGAAAQPLEAVRAKIVAEVTKATSLDVGTKSTLRSFWKPNDGALDDDLSSLPPDDPDLTQLLD